MPFAGPTRHMFAGVAAVVAVLTLAGATLVWRITGAKANAPEVLTAAQEVAVEPAPTTTSSTTTSSTTTSTSTTSTTVKPKPVTTTSRPPRTTVATTPPTVPPAPRVTQPPPPPATSAPERCAAALQWVGQRGLLLPTGWGFRCPGVALENGTPRWGVACWNCMGDGVSWIAVDIGRIGPSDATLRYVVAHEVCHAHDYVTTGLSTEVGADLCAGLHGAPRP